MSQLDFFDMPEVIAILDEFCDSDKEPDWKAIEDTVRNSFQPAHSLTLKLLHALHFLYEEDFSAIATQVWARKHGIVT